MRRPRILVQLDCDPQASVFDAVVALDAGADHLLRHGAVTPQNVRGLVYGAMFTRGGEGLKATAIFIGGSDVARCESLLAEVRATFFAGVRVSVMLDPNGANTTAAAAVLAAAKHVPLAGARVVVLGATGPVGQRVVRLLARQGAQVHAASRSLERAAALAEAVQRVVDGAQHVEAVSTATPEQLRDSVAGRDVVVSAGAPRVTLLPESVRRQATSIRVVIDLNAVPPVGIEGVHPTDDGRRRDDTVCYGALGIGGIKMKIHKAAIERLFQANDLLLDAEEIFQLGTALTLD
jgi:hypothetical protein